MCRVFPTSLTGAALEWFRNRPHKSIPDYVTLCTMFLAQYCGNKKKKKSIASLFTVRQKRGDTLQDFLSRFNTEASEIADCHPATAIETFKLAIIQGTKFHTSLVKYSPPDMQTLNAKAQIYIWLEENIAHRAQHATLVTVENKPRERIPTPKIQKSQRSSTSITQAPEKRSLRRQVENMIARGELTDYLMTKEYVKPREVYPRKVEGTQVKVINAIHGRSEDDQEFKEVYRFRLRATHKLRKISLVNAINSGSISIGFGDGDLSRVQLPHEDPLVIILLVANCMIIRVLVDLGSNAIIITKTIFDQLEIPSSSIRPTSSPLMGFDGTRVDPLGVIDLSVTVAKRTLKENFVLTEIHHSYNLIMGRGWIHRMRGVPSTLYQVMRCLSSDEKEVKEEEEIAKPTEETLEAVEVILGDPQKVTYLGSSSTSEENEALIDVIRSNADAFAWDHSDMVGIDPLVSYHSLKMDPEFKPVKQKHRRFAPERNHIIAEKVSKLLQAGFIREVQYPQ
ncbi:uncharacterized protein LOC132310040 [Cornus florida]|uniref:uncharacterized protein LOC132310040 n=1 Tax=Cornus florida TaxID=4283 RepID=UPI00289BAF80|nr:uncharacterized protein LOC132310040 [Cornus florida]